MKHKQPITREQHDRLSRLEEIINNELARRKRLKRTSQGQESAPPRQEAIGENEIALVVPPSQ